MSTAVLIPTARTNPTWLSVDESTSMSGYHAGNPEGEPQEANRLAVGEADIAVLAPAAGLR